MFLCRAAVTWSLETVLLTHSAHTGSSWALLLAWDIIHNIWRRIINGCLKTVFLCFDTLRHYKKWLFEKLVLTYQSSICEMKLVLQPTFLSVPVLWRLLLWRGDYVLSVQCVSTLETCVITECIQHILWQPDTGGRVQRYLLFSATQHQGSNMLQCR